MLDSKKDIDPTRKMRHQSDGLNYLGWDIATLRQILVMLDK